MLALAMDAFEDMAAPPGFAHKVAHDLQIRVIREIRGFTPRFGSSCP